MARYASTGVVAGAGLALLGVATAGVAPAFATPLTVFTQPPAAAKAPAPGLYRGKMRTNNAPLIMRCEMGAGHAGPSGRYDLWREEARTLTFLVTTV